MAVEDLNVGEVADDEVAVGPEPSLKQVAAPVGHLAPGGLPVGADGAVVGRQGGQEGEGLQGEDGGRGAAVAVPVRDIVGVVVVEEDILRRPPEQDLVSDGEGAEGPAVRAGGATGHLQGGKHDDKTVRTSRTEIP